MDAIRLRFAPSPTGPLHIGGVRTALYNYLMAKKLNGRLVLRIEDTDQLRWVKGAEEYIIESLQWCGLHFDEGPHIGGLYGPYRQSERKNLYLEYAQQLIHSGTAYYAFDTPEELEMMRTGMESQGVAGVKYGIQTRYLMKNSLTFSQEQTEQWITSGHPYTIRMLIPDDEKIEIQDLIRDSVYFQSNELDDKIILKADGMPTYHLANVVDDHLMEISHVIRGEEWLSSTAHHILLYRFFDWKPPFFAHLPLILKPTGKGKLSKRDGTAFGFPVFPLEWNGEDGEQFKGFREEGFLPEALVNFLAFLGWNPGDDREIMCMKELVDNFSIEKIVKSGARFDFEKARWYNQQYIISMENSTIAQWLLPKLKELNDHYDHEFALNLAKLMKERAVILNDFIDSTPYLFQRPKEYDQKIIEKKFKSQNVNAFIEISEILENHESMKMKERVNDFIHQNGYKPGEILPVLRMAITGSAQGPDLFDTLALIGNKESSERIRIFLNSVTSSA
ncbi:MAG TPA: glutamate--tRNA ligase [Saprospiraceae bacterium]|nr:glutamate--tRNA ligase [Saprospiraceae bacterium]